MKSGRITADMRFAPWLEAHPNCSLRSQLLISANVTPNKFFTKSRLCKSAFCFFSMVIFPKNYTFATRQVNH
jgi:hypothetical protein